MDTMKLHGVSAFTWTTADEKGAPMPAPPIIREIAKHPILSKVKLIAEPWDIGMYQVCGLLGRGWEQRGLSAVVLP